jgi:hypothetical protein
VPLASAHRAEKSAYMGHCGILPKLGKVVYATRRFCALDNNTFDVENMEVAR